MRRSTEEMWADGLPLSKAFIEFYGFPNAFDKEKEKANFIFLQEQAKQENQEAKNQDNYRSVQEDYFQPYLYLDLRESFCLALCDQLFARKLIAIGIEIYPTKKISRTKIPSVEFQIRDKFPFYESEEHKFHSYLEGKNPSRIGIKTFSKTARLNLNMSMYVPQTKRRERSHLF